MSVHLYPRRLMSVNDINDGQIDELFDLAKFLYRGADRDALSQVARGRVLSLLFFEPSTRTQFSFASAMQRLGGGVIGFSDSLTTSTSKGESLSDTIKIMSAYSDALVIRHSERGSLSQAVEGCEIPVISGGEGDGEHPTQALYDLLTIEAEFGRRDVTIGFYGDLRFGRTNHSLALLAARFGARLVCIPSPGLEMPSEYIEKVRAFGVEMTVADRLCEIIGDLDVLYVSRLQRERMIANQNDLQPSIEPVTSDIVAGLKPGAIVLHPLPRTVELSRTVDTDSRARYFEQARYGLALRTALIAEMLGCKEAIRRLQGKVRAP